MRNHVRLILSFISFILIVILAACGPSRRPGPASGAYFSPVDPPASRYVIDARVDVDQGVLEGRETIRVKNTCSRPLGVLAFDWDFGPSSSLEVSLPGVKLFPPADGLSDPQKRPLFVNLPEPLAPGAEITLSAAFKVISPGFKEPTTTSSRWYPSLWWDGLPHHDAFSVKVDVPQGWVLALSGRLDPKTGRTEAAAARTFGMFLGKGMTTASREADGVLVTSVFTEKGAKAAAICLETAADAVSFYKNWLGFYPFPFLTIVPGGSGRWGGYPVATGIVAIHGLETYVEGESPRHWQHITSHEIGHEYWSEWVLDPGDPASLWIAGGIFADTEYMTVRGFDPGRRAAWMGNYINAVPMYYDTTLDVTPDQEARVRFDRNNIVIHSKGPALMFALDSVLGRDVFLRAYKRCLRDSGGKRLDWPGFQRVCEAESGQSLDWFFEAWLRSNSYLCYAVESKTGRPADGGGFTTDVRLRRLGTMAMPVPVKAVFEDGTEQTACVDRFRLITGLRFTSRAPLRDVVLDPEGRWAMIKRPLKPISPAATLRLANGWDPAAAPDVYAAVRNEPAASPEIWYRLGGELFGANRTADALDCFKRVEGLDADPLLRFGALGWCGLLEDLGGRREAALSDYRKALGVDPGSSVSLSGLNVRIDRAWLEERLKTPFRRESTLSLPAQPTSAALESIVENMNYANEGRNPLMVFEKTRGLDLRMSGFWFKLGLMLFDSGFYRESLVSFDRTAALEQTGLLAFTSWVWKGHLNDLLGNRPQALACYRQAMKLDTGESMRHGQYRMTIDRAWVELRLNVPFSRTT